MPFTTSMRAILDLAVKLEESSQDFYQRVAALTEDAHAKQICLFFAGQEKEHIEAFKKIANENNVDIERAFSVDIVSLFNQEIAKAKTTGFQPVSYDFLHMTVDQALDFALNMELSTIAIYEEIKKEMNTNYDVALSKIIHEENQHVSMIEKVIKERDPQGKSQPREAKVIKPDKIIIRKVMLRPNISDVVGIAVIFLCSLGLIFAMIGPRIFNDIVNAIMTR